MAPVGSRDGRADPVVPLGTALFPGVVLPLQIFEPRYRRLMVDLLALPDSGDQRFFGVVAIQDGWEVERSPPPRRSTTSLHRPRPGRFPAAERRPASSPSAASVSAARARRRQRSAYVQAEVEWLVEEEQAEEAASDHDGVVDPSGLVVPSVAAAGFDDVVASVARGSMSVPARNVRGLFTCYVAEVSGLTGGGNDDPVPAVDTETGVLLHA